MNFVSATAGWVDGDVPICSPWGAHAEHFAIDADTGQILSRGTYDYEKKKGYVVTVGLGDGQGGHRSVVVSIVIVDVAD